MELLEDIIASLRCKYKNTILLATNKGQKAFWVLLLTLRQRVSFPAVTDQKNLRDARKSRLSYSPLLCVLLLRTYSIYENGRLASAIR